MGCTVHFGHHTLPPYLVALSAGALEGTVWDRGACGVCCGNLAASEDTNTVHTAY